MKLSDMGLITEAIKVIFECQAQANHDLCGEQREFLLPRIATAFSNLSLVFPVQALQAMETAKDAWGDPLLKD